MQESDPASPDQTNEAVQRDAHLLDNRTGGKDGVAKTLREAREEKGEGIPQISERLRIRAAYLLAIEEGRYRDLPGDTYAVGFVRAYAHYLGLDSGEIVRHLKREVSISGRSTSLVFPTPFSGTGAPKGLVLLFSAFLTIAIYSAWYMVSYRSGPPAQPTLVENQMLAPATLRVVIEESVTATVEERAEEELTAERVTPVTSGMAIATTGTEKLDLQTFGEITPLLEDALPEEPVSASGLPIEESISTMPEEPVSASGLPMEESISTMIVLRGKSDTWIEVRDEMGRSVMAGVLGENEIYRPPVQRGLTLAVGDAMGIEILIGGQATPSLGGRGAVLRRVLLDPTRLKAGNAVLD